MLDPLGSACSGDAPAAQPTHGKWTFVHKCQNSTNEPWRHRAGPVQVAAATWGSLHHHPKFLWSRLARLCPAVFQVTVHTESGCRWSSRGFSQVSGHPGRVLWPPPRPQGPRGLWGVSRPDAVGLLGCWVSLVAGFVLGPAQSYQAHPLGGPVHPQSQGCSPCSQTPRLRAGWGLPVPAREGWGAESWGRRAVPT